MGCNGVGRGPSRTTWPPAWIATPSAPPAPPSAPPATPPPEPEPISTAPMDYEPTGFDDIAPQPPPCADCGRMDFWECLAGNWHCMTCTRPAKASRLLARREQLLWRYPTEATQVEVSEPLPQPPATLAPAESGIVCDRCGWHEHRDVAIHDGQSVRRDCARCNRFLMFVVWHGEPGTRPRLLDQNRRLNLGEPRALTSAHPPPHTRTEV